MKYVKNVALLLMFASVIAVAVAATAHFTVPSGATNGSVAVVGPSGSYTQSFPVPPGATGVNIDVPGGSGVTSSFTDSNGNLIASGWQTIITSPDPGPPPFLTIKL